MAVKTKKMLTNDDTQSRISLALPKDTASQLHNHGLALRYQGDTCRFTRLLFPLLQPGFHSSNHNILGYVKQTLTAQQHS